jgi:hypothetical protein
MRRWYRISRRPVGHDEKEQSEEQEEPLDAVVGLAGVTEFRPLEIPALAMALL